jgi:metal-responsive CopG/Arc/MetJ family transcriptional regulator
MDQKPARKGPPAGSLSEEKFLMYMPRELLDAVEQARKARFQSRAGWLRDAATEKLERDRKEAEQ